MWYFVIVMYDVMLNSNFKLKKKKQKKQKQK